MAQKKSKINWNAPMAGRGADWIPPIERARIEEEQRRQAEADRRRWETVDSGVASTEDLGRSPTPATPAAPAAEESALSFQSLLDNLVRPATEYGSDLGEAAGNWAKSNAGARMFTQSELGNPATTEVARQAYELFNLGEGGTFGYLMRNVTQDPTLKSTAELGLENFSAAQAAQQELTKKYKDSGWLPRTSLQVAQSPAGYASLVPGAGRLFGATVAAEDVFNTEYTQARLNKADKESAALYASGQAAAELAGESIPVHKALDFLKDTPLGKKVLSEGAEWIQSTGQKIVTRTAATAGTEGATEVGTTWAQMALDKAASVAASDENLRKHAEDKLPTDMVKFWDATAQSFSAGALGGTTVAAPMNTWQVMKQHGQDAADLTNAFEPYLNIVDEENKRLARAAKPRVRVPATSTQTAAPAPAPEVVDDATDEQTIDQMISQVEGLRSEGTTQFPTGEVTSTASTRDVVKELADSIGERPTRKIVKLMRDNNLTIVERDSHIPAGAQARGAAGFYDGKRTYIVANRIDKTQPIIGQLMETLSHEITHAGDVSGKLDSVLVGKENNAKLVGKITDIADKKARASGRTLADVTAADPQSEVFATFSPEEKAYHYATANTTNEGAKNLEMTAYYVNFARQGRGNATLMKDILSAVRHNWKSIMPGEYDINLKDVAYLSDKLVTQAAVQGERLTGNVAQTVTEYGGADNNASGLAMIAGPTATSFQTKKAEGATYKGRVDRQDRFEIPDYKSTLTDDEFTYQDLTEGKTLPMDEVLNHEDLYKEYPWAAKIGVRADPDMPANANGYYDSKTNEVVVAPSWLKRRGYLRKLLLHEVQHAIQTKEGFISGENPLNLIDKGIIEAQDAADKKVSDAVGKFEWGAAMTSLPRPDFLEWKQEEAALQAQGRDRDYIIEEFVKRGYAAKSRDGAVRTQGTKLDALMKGRITARIAANTERKRAFDLYQRNYGEAEARNTEFRADLNESELAKLGSPEETMGIAEGRVEVARTLDTVPYRGGKVKPAEVSVRPEPELTGLAQKAFNNTNGFDRENIPAASVQRRNAAIRMMERMLVPGGFLDANLKETLLHAKSLPASLAVQATYLNNQFREAIDENVRASNGKYDDASFRKMLADRIEKIDAFDDVTKRKQAMNALERDFPGMGKALNAIRQYKIDRTVEIMSQRKLDPKPLTDKEKNTFKKMIFNAERYTTRAYMATFDKNLGKEYGEKMLRAHEVAPESEEGKIVQTALDYIIRNELTIPDVEVLVDMKTDKIRRLHENWIGETSQFSGDKGKAQMIANLVNMNPKTKEQIDARAYEIARELLGLDDTKSKTTQRYTRNMKQNRGILEKRTDIPPELRKLMGEITDPQLREAISLNRMHNLIAKTKFLNELFQKGEGKWWSEVKEGKFGVKLSGEAYGPLDGKYITQDTSDAITGAISTFTGIDDLLSDVNANGSELIEKLTGYVFPVAKRIMGLQKTYGVVLDIYNGLINMAGALALMAPMNGMIPGLVGKSGAGMKGAGKVLLLDIWDRKFNAANSEIVQELIKAGVTDSATMGEFKGHAYDTIRDKLAELGGVEGVTTTQIMRAVWNGVTANNNFFNALRTAYAFMDVWVKAATYYDRKEFNKAYSKAEGLNWTDEEILRKSGFEAASTNVSYERAIPAVKMLERHIPLFMFLTYKSETVRAATSSFIVAYQDFKKATKAKTPEGRLLATAQGSKRLIGTLAVTGGVIAATMKVLGAEDEEEKKKRALDFPWMQHAIMAKLGIDAEGNEVMFNLSRLDPLGPLNETVIAIANAKEGETAEAAIKAMNDLIFAKSSGFQAVMQLGWDASIAAAATALGKESIREWDTDIRGKGIVERNYPELYAKLQEAPGDSGENLINVIEKLFVPGSLKPVIDDKGKLDGFWQDMPRKLGMSMYVRNPDKALVGKAIEYGKEMKELKKQHKELLGKQNVDIDDLLELRQKEYEAFTDLSSAYDGYLAFDGKTVEDALGIIDDKKLAPQLRTGEFKSKLLDSESLDRWYKEQKKKSDVDTEALELQYEMLRELYMEAS